MLKATVFIVALALFGLAFATTGNRVLVLYDDDAPVQTTHSQFFDDLRGRGFDLTFKDSDDSSLSIDKYGEWLYDHIVVFASSASDFGGSLDKGKLIDFVDAGHNLLVAADSNVDAAVRLLGKEHGVEFEPAKTAVIDHFHFDKSDEGDHTLIAADHFNEKATVIFGGKPSKYGSVLFRGVGQDLDDENNPLLYPLLTASSKAYSAKPGEGKVRQQVTGHDIVLVSAFQGRNNARAVFSGSLELFSNKFFSKSSGNRAFALDVTLWAFQQRGVLRAQNVRHHRQGETQAPAHYRIKDDVEYSVDIHQWDADKKTWVPFAADDVQLEFTRLDPHIRAPLKHDSKGHFSLKFTIPDVYGIFTFRVNYQRLGYTFLDLAVTTPVRPYRHDEYERFLPAAYPYYTGAFSMLAGLFVFSVFFLFTKEHVAPKKK